ncbi:TIGR01620 family protein [Stappia sp. F7233]|uniref:TIGR01620 family protein n=1 Tax=Stappia albiluteola TaxID=2758565 RepID=A0A839AH84_9HYPH|nr:TIGR01620 family protein [Stappia albiluteola]MBA5778446.1 TIGR01620 family protein [Stappia albiluteola]
MTDRPKTKETAHTGRKPTAFRLDDGRVRLDDASSDLLSRETRIVPAREEDGDSVPAAIERKPFRWGRLFAAGLAGLVSLAVGLSIDALIRDLFSRSDWLGFLGVGLAALAALGLLGLAIREIAGLMRLSRIDALRDEIAAAAERDDAKAAKAGLQSLMQLYHGRPETAAGRRALSQHLGEVIDGRDLVILAERDLLKPLDEQARRFVTESAKRVSVVTALSPRALVDLLMVLFENLRLIRRLSALYGGRPGFVGFLRLSRSVAAHLAITGGMAAGDTLVSQVLGHGLAARLSARLGEGVVNGLLTARIGIAAIDVCRPSPFVGARRPAVSDIMGELFKGDPQAKALLEEAEKEKK